MGLVRGQIKQLEIPDEPGQWVVIKKLPWGLLDAAREVRTKTVIEKARSMGPEIMASLRGAEERGDVQEALADETNEFDTGFLLRHAVESWSYADAPLPDATEDLEEATAAWLKKEIVAFNKRGRSEAEQLDGTSLSTAL